MNDNNPQVRADTADAGAEAPAAAPTALAAAEAKASENWNSYLRTAAELDNYRKRMDRELDNARKYAIERFAQELIGVIDSLEAGLSAAGANSGSPLLEGTHATLKQLQRAFEKAGIKIIDPQGQPFDPAWHEAMVAQASADQPANTVLSVIQKGYSLNGRLLRPARVVVSKAPGGDAN
ncbi:MAG TPA: nucleotide exchange factor GrpE [Steroidobacteraceae bacterium]|nr:nucleotide exchange factor GrpE [Steroidobacteraceae bacterium]